MERTRERLLRNLASVRWLGKGERSSDPCLSTLAEARITRKAGNRMQGKAGQSPTRPLLDSSKERIPR